VIRVTEFSVNYVQSRQVMIIMGLEVHPQQPMRLIGAPGVSGSSSGGGGGAAVAAPAAAPAGAHEGGGGGAAAAAIAAPPSGGRGSCRSGGAVEEEGGGGFRGCEEEGGGGIRELKASLVAALRGVGAFATSGVMREPMPPFTPAITVRSMGVGRLGLPLIEAQGRQLYAAGAPAAHGLGPAEAPAPAAARGAREFDPAEVIIGAAWDSVLHAIVVRASEGLGLPAPRAALARAELHKLLVFEEGDSWLSPVQPAEEDVFGAMYRSSSFGSLLIVLPSKHEGGCLTVRHGQGAFSADFGGARSDEELCYAAFFADCPHEMAPITAGRRLVLAYHLSHGDGGDSADYCCCGGCAGGGCPGCTSGCDCGDRFGGDCGGFGAPIFKAPAIAAATPAELLAGAVARWRPGAPNCFALPLEHRYEGRMEEEEGWRDNLSFDSLERRDKDLTGLLTACPELEVHLALVRLKISRREVARGAYGGGGGGAYGGGGGGGAYGGGGGGAYGGGGGGAYGGGGGGAYDGGGWRKRRREFLCDDNEHEAFSAEGGGRGRYEDASREVREQSVGAWFTRNGDTLELTDQLSTILVREDVLLGTARLFHPSSSVEECTGA
jgi:hypothetical protein